MPNEHSKKKGGSAPAGSAAQPVTYTLPGIVKSLGAATEAEVAHYTEGTTKADLITEGARVGTSRIDTDTARLYGIAADFLKKANPEQLDALMGVSLEMIRVAAWAAQKGSSNFEALQKAKRKGGGDKEQLAVAADKVRTQAMQRRTALRRGLRALAAGDAALLARIEHANGTAEEPKTLADGLSSLVEVAEDILKKPSDSMKVRLKDARLSKAMLDQDRALATKARAAGEEAQGVVGGGEVSQADVDYWDGINLFLLGNIMGVFDSGNTLDPSIPRLSPNALFSYYSRRRPSSKAGAAGGAKGKTGGGDKGGADKTGGDKGGGDDKKPG